MNNAMKHMITLKLSELDIADYNMGQLERIDSLIDHYHYCLTNRGRYLMSICSS